MASSYWLTRLWRRGGGAPLILLTLLALACQAAPEPTAAPEEAAPVAEATAAPEPTAVPQYGVLTTSGRYEERAGLRIYIPEGYEFGGPIIPQDPRPPRYGGVAIEANPGDPPSLDPYHTTAYLADKVRSLLYDRLVHYTVKAGTDPYNNVAIPGLAESWEISGDFLTYTFHLRKGVKFHNLAPVNGRELDAEDVKATWELYRDPGSIIRSNFASVDRVDVIDKYTVALHLKKMQLAMLGWLAEPASGALLPRELTDPAIHARRTGGIGTGPFMVDKPYEFKVGISYQRNPDYWMLDDAYPGNRLPYLDGFRHNVIPDSSARVAAFRTGKIDFGAAVPGGIQGIRSLLKSLPTILVQQYVPPFMNCYCLRLDKEPWSDVRVRRALSMALDYDSITRTIQGVPPLAVPSLIAGFWHGSDDRLETLSEVCQCPWYSYDSQRAKQLLAEAGFPSGLTTDLAFFPYAQTSIEYAELYASYWGAIGVEVKLLSQDYTVFRRNVDLGGWDNLSYSFYCCPSISSTIYGQVEALIPGGPKNSNAGFINDPKMTALAEAIKASYDKSEAVQRELIRQARVYLLDQVFTIPYVGGVTSTVFAPRLRNFQPTTNVLNLTDYRQFTPAWIDDAWSFAK